MELLTTMECCLKGLCKITGLLQPAKKDIHHLSLKAFKEIDQDESKFIDYEEFAKWIENDQEIQDFLVCYNKFQTKEHGLRMYDKFFKSLMKAFKFSCDRSGDIHVQKHLPWFEKNTPSDVYIYIIRYK